MQRALKTDLRDEPMRINHQGHKSFHGLFSDGHEQVKFVVFIGGCRYRKTGLPGGVHGGSQVIVSHQVTFFQGFVSFEWFYVLNGV